VVNSGQFCGIAEMASEVRFNQIYNYWWEDLKWSGVFDINWIYIRDIHHADVQNISHNNTPITSLKDGSEIDFQAGRTLLEVFRNTKNTTDIFESFLYMDEREKILRSKRDSYYELFKKLNEKGLIEEYSNDKQTDKKGNSQRGDFKGHKQDRGIPRKNFRQSDVYYEKKE